ncbi:MAG: hypothetical protein DSZ31_04985 [Gammaproteobacteria bacterium]|nr:MAG: hypothetical protein DSZ31_04985 [Gammaproteobacteria bacterium]
MPGEIYYPNITGTFDWGTLLDGLMKLESVRLNRLEFQKKQVDKTLSYLKELKSTLEDLVSFTSGIEKNSWFSKKSVEVSNPDVAKVTIIDNDIPEYTASATVTKVAQVEVKYFDRVFSSPDEQFNSDNPDAEYQLTLTYAPRDGGTVSKTFTFYGRDTLQSLIDQINNDPDIGKYLHAYAMYVGDGYQFALVEKDIEASDYESSPSGPYDVGLGDVLGRLYILQGAQNSELRIGDHSFTDPGYTFTNVLPGLKVEVKKAGDFTVTVRRDFEGIAKVFGELVEKVNKVIEKINDLTKVTVSGDKVSAPKISDYELKELKIRLQRLFFPLLEDSNISKYNVIDFDKDSGKVQLNLSQLRKFLEENPEENWQILYDIVQNAKDLADLATNSAYVAPLIKGYERIEKRIEEKMEYYRSYLAEKEEFLRKRFASIESYIAGLQQIQAKINNILAVQMLLTT